MSRIDVGQFASEALNTSGIRDFLRRRVEQIDHLESLDCLRNLRLTRLEIGEEKGIFMAFYEGIATPELYPHVRSGLIRKGVINRGNALESARRNLGLSDEYESVRFGVSGNSIQVILKAYNPKHPQV